MADSKKQADVKEPSILVRPIRKLGGLDNIHLALLVLVAILIALVVVVSYSKPVIVKSISNSSLNCTYSAVNGTCANPMHNATQIKLSVERQLANYQYLNSSLSQIAYLANVSAMNLTYAPASRMWYASLPVQNPSASGTFVLTMTVNDITGSVQSASIQTVLPPILSQSYVASQGVIRDAKASVCAIQQPLHIQWFIDPYAPGAVQSLLNYTALQRRYGSKINASVDIIFSQYTTAYANAFGTSNAQALGQYTYCASSQPNFKLFAATLNSAFTNSYMSPNNLNAIAQSSGLNMGSLASCLNASSTSISAQELLAQYYGIVFTPTAVTNCEYISVPPTVRNAVCYSNSTMC